MSADIANNEVAELTASEKKKVNLIWLSAILCLLVERFIFPVLGAYLVVFPLWFLIATRFVPDPIERKRTLAATWWLTIIFSFLFVIHLCLIHSEFIQQDSQLLIVYSSIEQFCVVSIMFLYIAAVGWRIIQGSFGRFKPSSKGYTAWSRPWFSLCLLPAYIISVICCLIPLFIMIWISSV